MESFLNKNLSLDKKSFAKRLPLLDQQVLILVWNVLMSRKVRNLQHKIVTIFKYFLNAESCDQCGFGLCKICQKFKEALCKHDAEECQLLQKISKRPNQQECTNISGLFNVVFPLRFLRLRTSNPELYKQLSALEGHAQERLEQVSVNQLAIFEKFELVRNSKFAASHSKLALIQHFR